MDRIGSGGGAGAGRAADIAKRLIVAKQRFQPGTHEIPAADLLRFFLDPEDFASSRIGPQPLLQQRLREGVKLFKPQDCDPSRIVFLELRFEVVIYLAAADQDALDAGRGDGVADDRIKPARRELVKRRGRGRGSKQALGRHDKERFAPILD